ncbi:MAG: hypothetical protein Tsb002_16140 [Wenzhouxiangellaceae bacterium]
MYRVIIFIFLTFFTGLLQAQTSIGKDWVHTPVDCTLVSQQFLVRTPKTLSSSGFQTITDYANAMIAGYGGNLIGVYEAAAASYAAFAVDGMTFTNAESMAKNEADILRVEQVCQFSANSSQINPGWALDRIDQSTLPLDQTFDIPNYTSQRTHIYILDQAIRGFFPNTVGIHNDLTAARAPQNQPSDHVYFANVPTSIRNSLSCTIHGTAVAGVIAGQQTGIARNSLLHSYATHDCQSPAITTSTLVYNALNTILDKHLQNYPNERAVINFSSNIASSTMLQQVITDLSANGILFVMSMGNDDQNGCNNTIRNMAETFTVGASGSTSLNAGIPTFPDTIWEQSNYGPCTDIYAPGSVVPTTAAASTSAITSATGTSFAAPLVTATAAVYLEQYPVATVADTISAIQSNASINTVANVPQNGGGNDLLNICFLNGSCSTQSGPPTLLSASVATICPGSFGLTAQTSNIDSSHRIGIDFNPFDSTAVIPAGQTVQVTSGTLTWCIPATTIDGRYRWNLTIFGEDTYLSDSSGNVIDGPIFVQRPRPSSGSIEKPNSIEYPANASGADIQITRSTDSRVTKYQFYASSDTTVTTSDHLLEEVTTSGYPNSIYFVRIEVESSPGPFGPTPGDNPSIPSGTWYLGARACDSSNQCSAILSNGAPIAH